MWRLSACTRQAPGSFAARMKRFSGWLIGRHATEWDRQTLINHGGSGRAGSLRGDGALPTEFPMTAHFGRACIYDGQQRLEDRAQQERAGQGASAFTPWLHSIHALFQHLPFLTVIESYEIVFLFYVAAGLGSKLKHTSSWRPRASHVTGTKWHWWNLFFLWYWLWGLTSASPFPTLTAIFYVSFCCHSYK